MSATSSAATTASPKAQNGQVSRQGSQAPRVNNGAQTGARKAQNGSPKTDAARRSPQASSNGKQGQNKQQAKPKTTSTTADYLRQRGATVELVNLVAQVRDELGGYYSDELIYNTLIANGNSAEATRTALTQSKASSWASKVNASAAVVHPLTQGVPAPAHIAAAQQGPRPRKAKNTQAQKPASPAPTEAAVVAAPEPAVDPEQMEKSLQSALQATQTQEKELLGLQTAVVSVRAAQSELSTQKEALLQKIAQHEAEIATARASIQTIDATLAEHKSKLSELQKTISLKTAKQ